MSSLFINKRILTGVVVAILGIVIILYHTSGYFVDQMIATVGLFFVVLCIAIWKPFVAFAIFVGVIPLEIISVFPEHSVFFVRPYQMFGIACLIGCIAHRSFIMQKMRVMRWCGIDALVVMFVALGFMIVLWADDMSGSFLQSVIVASFGVLYFIVRLFVSGIPDALATLPLLIASGFVVSMYAIIQNIIFRIGGYHLEVMPGRPNATFAEPDWLGVYLVFIIAASLTYLYHNAHHRHLWRFFDIALFISTIVIITAVIITVARSAWIGVFTVFLVYYLVLIAQKKYKLFARHFLWSISVFILALGSVLIFQLTTFALGDRAHSAGTGMQKITIACDNVQSMDQLSQSFINTIDDLSLYGCRHINLEDIIYEQSDGYYVTTVFRPDPNIGVRTHTYNATFMAIAQRPWTGYGWGSSGSILGNDPAGTPLNASNVLFEVVLSIGVIGALILCGIFVCIGLFIIRAWSGVSGGGERTIALFACMGSVAIIVPNLFNAGILLGYVWVFFGIVAIMCKR